MWDKGRSSLCFHGLFLIQSSTPFDWLFGRTGRFHRNRIVWFDLGIIEFCLGCWLELFHMTLRLNRFCWQSAPFNYCKFMLSGVVKESIFHMRIFFLHHLNLGLLLKVLYWRWFYLLWTPEVARECSKRTITNKWFQYRHIIWNNHSTNKREVHVSVEDLAGGGGLWRHHS